MKRKIKKTNSKKTNILVVHGPNLNLLGEREPEVYGRETLTDLNKLLKKRAREQKVSLRIYQSNGEGEIINFIQKNRKWAQGIVINPGAYTHYSYAIRDCISAVNLPTVEVHLSDINAREGFRKISVVSAVCIKQISGQGFLSYVQGINEVIKVWSESGRQ